MRRRLREHGRRNTYRKRYALVKYRRCNDCGAPVRSHQMCTKCNALPPSRSKY